MTKRFVFPLAAVVSVAATVAMTASAVGRAFGVVPAAPTGWVVSSADFTIPGGGQGLANAACPAGLVPWGGGALAPDVWGAWLNGSLPEAAGGLSDWFADIYSPGDKAQTGTVYAVCAAAPANYSENSGSWAVAPHHTKTGTVTCPLDPKTGIATDVLAGGAEQNEPFDGLTSIQSSYPNTIHSWRVVYNNPTSGTSSFDVVIVCGEPTMYRKVAGTHVTVAPGAPGTATVACPGKLVEAGGGGFIKPKAGTNVYTTGIVPRTDSFGYGIDIQNASTNPVALVPYAICVG